LKLNKLLYVVTEQPWNAFEDSGTHLPVDGNSQGLQLHNFPSESFGLNASEVGICLLYYHECFYMIRFGVSFLL
jgi:hypothetical protein